ncbi:MAG: outer membrane beta-barrel protein [Yoonia sp.]|nr:outer membrane beta-barrel protein [Yoonia sp.]
MRQTVFCLLMMMLPGAAMAEVELSFYGGAQNSPHSVVSVAGDTVIPDDEFRMGWVGKSFSAPPYYGIRATVWKTPSFGYGLDFAHNKIYPQEGDLPAGYETLEFTDGLNTLTINVYRRWENALGSISPYVGGGLGVAIPHVEVTYGGSETFGYQVTGPAATWIAGASLPINDRWSVFGEYKGTFSMNTAELETGGTLKNDVVTNAVNLGLSFSF